MSQSTYQQSSRNRKPAYLSGGETPQSDSPQFLEPPDKEQPLIPDGDPADPQANWGASAGPGWTGAVDSPDALPLGAFPDTRQMTVAPPAPDSWWKRIFGGQQQAPDAGPTQPGVSGAADALEALVKQRPVQGAPSWWQRVAAAGLGAAEGYSNAAGRIRHPIDIAASTQSILHPGYADKLAAWQSRVMPAQAALELESQKLAAQEKAEQISAQAEERLAHAQQRMNLADPNYGKERIDPAWAKANAPEVAPNKQGEYWVDKQTLREMQSEGRKPIIIPADATAVIGGQVYKGGPRSFAPRPDPTPRNLNIEDVLLHPDDFPPETVKTAKRLDAERHRDPQGGGGQSAIPVVAPANTLNPGFPPRLTTFTQNGVKLISDGTKLWKQDGPTGQALLKEIGK
jgi:hypothetical protein